ncbi:MAG: acetyl-CoA carboxylase biotin carboxyl carrier protein subunit [Dehalococcoidia bacterium]|nr:acetyl-CoA carboxylase biotin carboxyl carrier protein subunit [Dehalococcoidia bacterium]
MPPDTASALPRRLRWLRDLLVAVEAADIAELELGTSGLRVFVRRRTTTAAAPHRVRPPHAADKADTDTEEDLIAVRSPLTGMFYSAPSPQDSPYVSVGDPVEEDQVVALVEAMKVFNEIRSEHRGVVERIVAQSGQLVHADQPLLLLRSVEGEPLGGSPLASV